MSKLQVPAEPGKSVVSVGDTFGSWVVVAAAPPHPKHKWKRWKVECATCKVKVVRDQGDLRGGRTAGCKKCSWRKAMSKKATCSLCGGKGHRSDICPMRHAAPSSPAGRP